MYASHFNWLQVSFRRTSLSSTGFESRKGERFPRAQGRRYLPVSASILLYFESLILNPTLRGIIRDYTAVDKLIASAEVRRDRTLREIERRRDTPAQTLATGLQRDRRR